MDASLERTVEVDDLEAQGNEEDAGEQCEASTYRVAAVWSVLGDKTISFGLHDGSHHYAIREDSSWQDHCNLFAKLLPDEDFPGKERDCTKAAEQ